MITVIVLLSICSLLIAAGYAYKVLRTPIVASSQPAEEKTILHRIHKAIASGASTYLSQQTKALLIFILLFSGFIYLVIDDSSTSNLREGLYTALSFAVGAITSILSGFIGMKIATAGNVRTTGAARSSLQEAFQMALHSGAVMGFGLVGLALLGLVGMYLLLQWILPQGTEMHLVMEMLAGFGLGGSSIALFARVGGGIFTKAADVGADLVGKVEKGIPEDDPRNPAVIADNVGDNVGDVAGMGADLFGSCAESTCAALVIGSSIGMLSQMSSALFYPIMISAIGIPIAFITMFLTNAAKTEKQIGSSLKKMLIYSTGLMAVAMYFVTSFSFPKGSFEIFPGVETSGLMIYGCLLTGLLSGLIIGLITEYYTSHAYTPVRNIAKASETGAATNIIFGIALGYKSAVIPILIIAANVVLAYSLAGMYGVAICALGMLGTLIIGLTVDAYGPVADNAGGIAEMAGMKAIIRERTDILDATGNTTAAIGKGFAISSAIITSLALFAAFITRSKVGDINLLNPYVLGGVFIGGMLPFIFSSMTMQSVGKAAHKMIEEVRRQFHANPNIMKGIDLPDYKQCIEISTKAALQEMILPGLLILFTPFGIGYLFGVQALAGLLAGSLASGGVLAIAKSNAGGAWDNAKKYIEKGHHGGKGSDPHKASVVGDTVGDPFKDTSGPSLNILLKLMAILSLVFVPFFVEHGGILLRLLSP